DVGSAAMAPASGASADALDSGTTTDSEGLPGPPADSLVVVKQPELFARLRAGFQLDDVDEPAVASQLNWFANHPDFLERTWGRAGLWLYYIVGQLEQRKMPAELALLPVIESAFEPYAYSRARASGLWQFISDTGRRFGLKQDWWYDGRRDPIEATRAALDYLQALHDEFDGDWLLAVAAYNCGELAVSRAIQRNQRLGKPTDFWHLKLPTETRGYVPELLAMRRLVANPERYGLEFSRIPNEPYFVAISTGGQIDLKVVADIASISVEDLYELNPAFHRWATDPTGPYRLLVPSDAAEGLQDLVLHLTPEQRMRVGHYTVRRGDTIAMIASRYATKPDVIRELNDLSPSDLPVIDSELRVPAPDIQLPEKAARAAMLVDSPGRRLRRGSHKPNIHVVRRGDTLYALAQRLGTDVQTLAQANGMRAGDRLHAGQKLRVGGSDSFVADASPGAGYARSLPATGAQAQAPSDGGRRMIYKVRRGDTLYGIARLLQVSVSELMGWNGMSGEHNLKPGQTLVAFVKARSAG
ncbi:MAG TPA: LysM peptidoglycan-binding domain-containing protein, partial [Steroidobacteraceae bacterium]|nr:LysM peptidoglycan-binding domain-containing protein [Steroidobacteraceae bacterium]